MNNINITYRVTGRYMAGPTISSYHLVGSDGSQIVANKDRVIYMISNGQIENLRLQRLQNDKGTEEWLIRGKGVNLTSLPVYDINKGDFRTNNQASHNAANTNVMPKKDSGLNPMGQLTITKRIMYKTNCLGYMVLDLSGKEIKLTRTKVVELAIQRLISNATVQRYLPKDSTKHQLILRGAGCDLGELPTVVVDKNGNIINKDDSNDNKNNEKYAYIRAIKMKRGGIVYNALSNQKLAFESGDYIVCGPKGVIRPVKEAEAKVRFTCEAGVSEAICDNSLDNLNNYPIELFGSKVQTITSNQVKAWNIVKIRIS